jgi:hypothetical protein
LINKSPFGDFHPPKSEFLSISSEPINPLLYVVWILTGAFLFFMLLMLIGSVSKKKGGKN